MCAGAKSINLLSTARLNIWNLWRAADWLSNPGASRFCCTSPFEVSICSDSAKEIARAMAVKWQAGPNGGVVAAKPDSRQFAMAEEASMPLSMSSGEGSGRSGVVGKRRRSCWLAWRSRPVAIAEIQHSTGVQQRGAGL
ncbi:hypothetical protein ACNKHQ_12935 [Shigella flexneri]